MSAESNGFQVMCGGETSALGVALVAIPVAIVVIPLGIFGYLVYKANKDPDTPEEDLAGQQAVLEASKTSGLSGAAVETLAIAKNRKTMKTPFGFRVPNLARFILPDAESMRGMREAGRLYTDHS